MSDTATMDRRDLMRLAAYDALGYDSPTAITKKLGEMERDNQTQREEIRDLKGKVPKDGSTVLTGEDAKRWDAFQKLGRTAEEIAADAKKLERWEALNLKPEEVATVQRERDELKTKDAARTRRDAIAAAVEAMGWPKDTAATLGDLKSLDGATFEVKTEKGKNAKGEDADLPVAYVTIAGQQPVKLSEFATKTESLKGLRTSAGTEHQEDRSYPEQNTGGGSGGAYDPVAEGKRRGEMQGTDKARRDTALS